MATPVVSMTVYYENGAQNSYNMQTAFGLYLKSSKYTPPEAKTEYVSVPGRDGDLDFTEVLYGSNGTVHYGNATLELVFKIADINNFSNAMMIADSMNGHRAIVHVSQGHLSGLNFYGRLSVSPIETAKRAGYITITQNVESRTVHTS